MSIRNKVNGSKQRCPNQGIHCWVVLCGLRPHLYILCTVKLRNNLAVCVYHLLRCSHMRPINQPTIIFVVFLPEKVGHL